jgi:uncharacterized protein involved in exopolysaccharide biosynthesis
MSAQLIPYQAVTTLSKQWRCFITVFTAVMVLGIGYLLFATPKYESVAELVVTFGDKSPGVSPSQGADLTPGDRHEIVLSHAAILESHDLAEAVISSFGIDKVYPDIASDPPSRGTPMDAAVREFKDNLNVEVGTQDNIITLTLHHPDKDMAPQLVQKMIDLYVSRQTTVYRDPHENFMTTEVKQAGDRLTKAQTALEAFKGEWHINDYDKEVENLLEQRGDIDNSLHSAKANLAQATLRQKELQDLMKRVPEKIPDSSSSEKYRSLDDARIRLADLKSKQSQMLATYDPNSPAMASLKAGIASAEADVKARTGELGSRNISQENTVYQTLQSDFLKTTADANSNAEPVRVLTEQLTALDHRLADLQKNRGAYNDLNREHQIAEETYHTLSLQLADAHVRGNLNDQHISPAMEISAPTVPYRTARPRKLITLLACIFGGGILGAGAALLREAQDDRFSSAEQVAYLLDLPVLASFERRPSRIPLELIAFGGSE